MSEKHYQSVEIIAAKLGVPRAWLRREIENNRVPGVRAGRRLLANIEAVRRAIEACPTRPALQAKGGSRE